MKEADRERQKGGPSHSQKDAHVPDPDKHRHAQSAEELTERTTRTGVGGRRNGSDKNR